MDHRREQDEQRRREAEQVLERVDRDSRSPIDGALANGTARNVVDHFAAADADAGDRIDVWGKRIGRILALIVALLLIVHLWRTYIAV